MHRSTRRGMFAAIAAVALAVQPGAAAAAAKTGPAPGTIVVAGDGLDNQYSAVVVYPPHAAPSEIGGGTNLPCAAVNGRGDIFWCSDSKIVELPADGTPATSIEVGAFPLDLAVNDAGDLFVAMNDVGESHIDVSVFPADGSARYAIGSFDHPQHIAIDRTGDLYVTDSHGLWKIHPNGTGKKRLGGVTFADSSGIVVDASGNIYSADAGDGLVRVLSPTGAPVRTITGLSQPGSPAIERNGSVLLTVTDPVRIIRMNPDGSKRRTAIDHQFGDVAVYLPTRNQ